MEPTTAAVEPTPIEGPDATGDRIASLNCSSSMTDVLVVCVVAASIADAGLSAPMAIREALSFDRDSRSEMSQVENGAVKGSATIRINSDAATRETTMAQPGYKRCAAGARVDLFGNAGITATRARAIQQKRRVAGGGPTWMSALPASCGPFLAQRTTHWHRHVRSALRPPSAIR